MKFGAVPFGTCGWWESFQISRASSPATQASASPCAPSLSCFGIALPPGDDEDRRPDVDPVEQMG